MRISDWSSDVCSSDLNGRPHKYARIDTGNVQRFMNTTIEVTTPDGRVTMMTREGAILHRLYQSAMKGNVHAQIFLARRFEKHTESRMALALELKRIVSNLRESNRAPTEYEAMLLERSEEHTS